ncbi:hypothetical protein [Pseudactinotalea sp. Z1748]|uniref:hypothetical protein n=1 Tax=Pseudactinotalea sp. Z1748 TaxID=3413027 RepID=UPI003C7BFFC6
MSSHNQNTFRQPSGQPTGGQFAENHKPASELGLAPQGDGIDASVQVLGERLGQLVPGAHITDAGYSSDAGRRIDLRATTGQVMFGEEAAADVRVVATADADGRLKDSPTLYVAWNEEGPDGRTRWENTLVDADSDSVDDLSRDLDQAVHHGRQQARRQEAVNAEINSAGITRAEQGGADRPPQVTAVVDGPSLHLLGNRGENFTDITLDIYADDSSWAPTIKPAGLGSMPVPPQSRRMVLDRVGRSVLASTGQFEKMKGPGSGKDYLYSLMGRLQDVPYRP